MKTVTSFQHLEPYGIVPLTGEACGLMYRILCDVTEPGRHILARAFGIPAFALGEPWNRGTQERPHVGSILLPYDMLAPIAVFAFLESGCTEAWLLRDGGVIGVERSDDAELIAINRTIVGEKLARILRYGGTAGDRNVHVMTGRID